MLNQIAVLIVLILLNAYFAASEIAFISLNDAKIALDSKCKEVTVLNELQPDTADEMER